MTVTQTKVRLDGLLDMPSLLQSTANINDLAVIDLPEIDNRMFLDAIAIYIGFEHKPLCTQTNENFKSF